MASPVPANALESDPERPASSTPPDAVLVDIFADASESVKQYVDILATRGLEWGLLGPREWPRLWDRHVLNSAALATIVPREVFVVDVGSGAGLPGIPLALARPDLTITLLEPLQRRAEFLDLAVAELGLGDRVRVVRQRAEEHGDCYDVVTARAVASLSKLLRWCTPLLADDGELLALKGERVDAELLEAAALLRELRLSARVQVVQAHPSAEATRVCRVRKTLSGRAQQPHPRGAGGSC